MKYFNIRILGGIRVKYKENEKKLNDFDFLK